MKRWIRFVPFAVLLLFLALAFMYREGLQARVTVGEQAPAFSLELLDGGELSSSDLQGKPAIINFWTTWCVECRDESVALQRTYERYGDVVHVVGVNMREPAGMVRPFVQQFDLSYPIVLDRFEHVKRLYRVTGVPETWFVDEEGRATGRHVGPVDEEALSRAVVGLLGDEPVDRDAMQP